MKEGCSMDEAKRQWVRAWMRKASSDLQTAGILARPESAHPDTGVYHCQQAAEKSVKAFLAFADIPIKKTHEVDELCTKEPAFHSIRADADTVSPFATQFRYPSISGCDLEPTEVDLIEALAAARRIYDFVLSVLPAETHPI
jgi:HEPN domain-containing protein